MHAICIIASKNSTEIAIPSRILEDEETVRNRPSREAEEGGDL